MRKKICSSCGKIIVEGTMCECRKVANAMYVVKKSYKNEEKDKIHSKEWRAKRISIIKRDSFLCQRCFIKYDIINCDDLTVHHILSRKNNIELMFEDTNLICLCGTCNKQLGAIDKLDFEWNVSNNKEVDQMVL